ncbi:hypothetical protein KRR38_33995 [Novosphingobium sp. G106]|nr:hypothetical protein [Novosphingobium sp. G106]
MYGRSDGRTAAARIGPREKVGITILDDDGHVRTLDEIEADLIHLALSIYGGCVAEAARGLGIGRSTLYRKLESQGMSPS